MRIGDRSGSLFARIVFPTATFVRDDLGLETQLTLIRLDSFAVDDEIFTVEVSAAARRGFAAQRCVCGRGLGLRFALG